MKRLSELLNEAYDIRNRMVVEGSSVKYYTIKQSIKLLKDQLTNIEGEENKAVAVYQAIGDPEKIGAMEILYDKGSKIVVKDVVYDQSKYPSDKQRESWKQKYQDAIERILYDQELDDLYNKGKKLWQKKLEEEKRAKAEAEALAKTKAYKEFCDEYKGAHILFKAWALDRAYSTNNLWSKPEETIYNVMIKGLEKCKKIKASEAEEGVIYIIVDRFGPNMTSNKDDKPMGRYNIIGELSVVKYIGDGKWNPIMVKNYDTYSEPNMEKSKVEKYFDTDPYLVTVEEYLEKNEDAIRKITDTYIGYIKKDLEDNKKQEENGKKAYYHYSPLVISLIEKDTI